MDVSATEHPPASVFLYRLVEFEEEGSKKYVCGGSIHVCM